MKIYGLSRSRDKKGTIVKQEPMNYVNCIHTNVGGGWETMWVLVLEVYEDITDTTRMEQRADSE